MQMRLTQVRFTLVGVILVCVTYTRNKQIRITQMRSLTIRASRSSRFSLRVATNPGHLIQI